MGVVGLDHCLPTLISPPLLTIFYHRDGFYDEDTVETLTCLLWRVLPCPSPPLLRDVVVVLGGHIVAIAVHSLVVGRPPSLAFETWQQHCKDGVDCAPIFRSCCSHSNDALVPRLDV